MYAHSKQELRSTGAFHKTKLCRFMQTGHCTLGAKCNFAHSAVELREPETIEGVEPPPGLGWESMVSGLLSDDDDEDDTEKSLPPPGFDTRKAADKDIKSELPPPAYVPLGASSDSWSFATPMATEKRDRQVETGFKEGPVGMESFWDVQNLLASNVANESMGGFPDLGFYSPEGSNLAYGGAFNEFASPWAPNLLLEQYASLLGNTWDWNVFGDNAVIDEKDQLKMKSQQHLWQHGTGFSPAAQQ